MCKLKEHMDKGGHYDVQRNGVDSTGVKRGKKVKIKEWMQKGALWCKLKGRMDKEGHYDVEMKGWMQKGAL